VPQRLDAPHAMRQRRETVAHPFGTMKARMGATHFLTKTLPKVAAELALSVLAYNLTRVMNIGDQAAGCGNPGLRPSRSWLIAGFLGRAFLRDQNPKRTLKSARLCRLTINLCERLMALDRWPSIYEPNGAPRHYASTFPTASRKVCRENGLRK